MANVEKAITEIVDVIKHLVDTHVHWNMDMDRDLALAKLDAAKVHAVSGDVEAVVSDVVTLTNDVQGEGDGNV